MKKLLIFILVQLIYTTSFAQNPATKMVATISGKFEGAVSKQDLIENGKISITSKHKTKYNIIGFKYLSTKKDGILDTFESKSDSLTPKMKESIQSLIIGKPINLYNIKAAYKKDTVILNSILLKIASDIKYDTRPDTIGFSYNKATFANLIDGQLDTSVIRKTSKLTMLKKSRHSKIVNFELFGRHVFGEILPSANEELTSQMKGNLKYVSNNRFIYFYNIRILENKKIKQVPPIFIQVGDKIENGK
jgi:hypothetical protein